jgi:hypothetical protein
MEEKAENKTKNKMKEVRSFSPSLNTELFRNADNSACLVMSVWK